MTFIRIAAPTGPVWIGSTHLPRGEAGTRAAASQRLLVAARPLPDPSLLLGDFNQPADSWSSDQSSLRAWPTPAVSTYPRQAPVEPIDYCVAPAGLTVEAEVLPLL